jgi:hypothetical protein
MKILQVVETDKTSYHIRTALNPDKSFITHSWVKGFFGAFKNASGQIGTKNFSESQYMLVRDILSKPGHIVIVACDQFNPDVIYGYLVAELGDACLYIHWVYVKVQLRNFGIAASLMAILRENFPTDKITVTHLTGHARKYVTKAGFKYNPILWDWRRYEQGKPDPKKRKISVPSVPGTPTVQRNRCGERPHKPGVQNPN